ncbi:MAG: 2'-5' RNA ligase family protein [Mobilitalea sp.]
MNDKFLCVLAGYDSTTAQNISNLQNELYDSGYSGTQTKDIPHHITLETFPTGKENELILLLNRIATELWEFEITFNHIGIFGGAKVLFVAPDTDINLLNLKEYFGASKNWTPHSTLLIDKPEVIMSALPIVMNRFKPLNGKISKLYLYEFWPTRHVLTISLR